MSSDQPLANRQQGSGGPQPHNTGTQILATTGNSAVGPSPAEPPDENVARVTRNLLPSETVRTQLRCARILHTESAVSCVVCGNVWWPQLTDSLSLRWPPLSLLLLQSVMHSVLAVGKSAPSMATY